MVFDFFKRLVNVDRIINLKNRLLNVSNRIQLFLSLFSVFVIIYDLGFTQLPRTELVLDSYYAFAFTIFFFTMLLRAVLLFTFKAKWLPRVIDYSIIIVIFLILDVKVFFSGLILEDAPIFSILTGRGLSYFLIIVLFLIELSKNSLDVFRQYLNPAALFIMSFIFLIFVGTALLLLPNATPQGIGFIDALFTSTSAVCVTGLIVLDTATDFTMLGKIIILSLIQLGGLGIMTFSSFFGFFFKGSSYKSQLFLKDYVNEERTGEIFRTLFKIIAFTLSIELLGAALIFLSLDSSFFVSLADQVQFSVFHSISAFCNAGFSTLSLGLATPGFNQEYDMQLVIIFLIVTGGLGFPIFINFFSYLKKKFERKLRYYIHKEAYTHIPRIININTRIVVITTAILLVAGFVMYLMLENNASMKGMPWYGKIVTALFGSVTPRTAGFNTVDMNSMSVPAILVFLLLMWIGASPGSTGGGIKTTTFAVGILNTISISKGKDRLEIFRREIKSESVRRSFAIIMLSFIVIGISFFILTFTEPEKDVLDLVFECFSAYGTVGLTLGVTPLLSVPGKIVIMFAMLLGRVGTLTIFVAVIRKVRSLNYHYPQENIFIN